MRGGGESIRNAAPMPAALLLAGVLSGVLLRRETLAARQLFWGGVCRYA